VTNTRYLHHYRETEQEKHCLLRSQYHDHVPYEIIIFSERDKPRSLRQDRLGGLGLINQINGMALIPTTPVPVGTGVVGVCDQKLIIKSVKPVLPHNKK